MSLAVEVECPPAYRTGPEFSGAFGGEAADLAEAAGIPVDPEQRMALEVLLGESRPGKWSAFEGVVVAPRQNIKTHLFKITALAEVTLLDTELVMWSAHEFGTAMESMREILEIVESTDFLARRCSKVVNRNGEEAIEFGRQRIRFKARTKTGARGLTAPTLLLDEGFALLPAHIASLMPTMSALSQHGNPHILYGSSSGSLRSAVLRSLRDRGRRGDDPTLAYLEWSADEDQEACETPGCGHAYGVSGCVLDDETRWWRANLALGRRISVDFVRMERRSMPPEEFARERLGWWDEPADGVSGIPADLWASRADRHAVLGDPVVVGMDIDHGQMSSSIVADGGALHVARHLAGTGWLVDALCEIVDDHAGSIVAVDGTSGPARALIPTLELARDQGGCGLTIRSKDNPGGDLVVLDGPEVVDACETFLRDVIEDRIVHRDEGALNAAVAGAGRRASGDSWRWSRRDSTVPISPLTAATCAHWVARQVNVMHREEPEIW